MSKKVLIALVAGVVVILCCCLSVGIVMWFGTPAEDEPINMELKESDAINVPETITSGEPCDDTVSSGNYLDFHGVEKTILSVNPCEIMWLLAEESETYEVATANGKTMYVTVWLDYVNNTEPGESYTIRALDVPDTRGSRDNATVLVVRWVASEDGLAAAKAEVAEQISNIEL